MFKKGYRVWFLVEGCSLFTKEFCVAGGQWAPAVVRQIKGDQCQIRVCTDNLRDTSQKLFWVSTERIRVRQRPVDNCSRCGSSAPNL